MCSHVTDFLTDTEAVLHHLVRAIFLGIATFQIETSPSSSRSKGEAWELQWGKQRVTCLEEQKLESFWRDPSQQYQTEVNNCLGGKVYLLNRRENVLPAGWRECSRFSVVTCEPSHTLVVGAFWWSSCFCCLESSLLLVNNLSSILLLAIPVKPHWYARISRCVIVALVWDGFPFWINRRVSG